MSEEFEKHIVLVRYRTKSGRNAKQVMVQAGNDMAARATAHDQVLRMRGVIDVEETEWRGVDPLSAVDGKSWNDLVHVVETDAAEDALEQRAYQHLVARLDMVLREMRHIGENDMGVLRAGHAGIYHRIVDRLHLLVYELKQDVYWPHEAD